jgi:hypothetical protein
MEAPGCHQSARRTVPSEPPAWWAQDATGFMGISQSSVVGDVEPHRFAGAAAVCAAESAAPAWPRVLLAFACVLAGSWSVTANRRCDE